MKFCFRLLALALTLAGTALAQPKIDPPVPVRTVAPDYPPELRSQGVVGLVVVKITIDENGNVADPEVEKSSHNGFEKPALDAVKKWKFKPAREDGVPVAKKASIPIKFVLDS